MTTGLTEAELAAIEAQCRISNRYVAVGDVTRLLAEVRRLAGECERLRGLIGKTFNDRSRADCQWCDGIDRGRADQHAADCPAFHEDGRVR